MVEIAPGNEDQAAAWDGYEGEKWVRNAESLESGTLHIDARLFEAAAIARGERVLDIGCGNGGTTIQAAGIAAEGSALGSDLSGAMLDNARANAARAGVANVTFVQGDAQVYPFERGSFDVAISEFGSMFFADQVAAFSNIAGALAPGGRLVLVSWQSPDRVEMMREVSRTLGQKPPAPGGPPPDAVSPFRHADPKHTKPLLEQAGFRDVAFTDMSDPLILGRTVDDAFGYMYAMYGWMAEELDDAVRERAKAELRESLEAHRTADGVTYGSATWLITARRA